MALGDRIFWGAIIFVGIGFLWLRYIEPYVTSWVALAVGGAVSLGFIIWGPRPGD